MIKKCPIAGCVVSVQTADVRSLVFASAYIGKPMFVDCIRDECMAWQELASSVPDFIDKKYVKPEPTKTIGYCKLIDRKCH
jgi:hypothetical protein